jgi:N-acetylglucosamine-6-phosphate deacetylase
MSTESSVIGKRASDNAAVEVRFNDTITSVDDLVGGEPAENFLSPGFVDLQVNGFAGVDYNSPSTTTEAIAQSAQAMFRTGVTRFFATIITGSEERITGSARNLARAKEELARNGQPEAHALEAIHVEGPHLSPESGPRGAHPLEHIRPPDIEEFKRWQDAASGNIRLVTVSPEWDGTPDYVRALVRAGVVVSIGHTKATHEQIQAAADAGATMATHLGNAAHPMLPKTSNYIWSQLADDRLAACFIVDGIHIPQIFFKSCVRAKGIEKSILVTDAVMPAMCAPGPYKLGQVEVTLREDGSVVLRDDSGRLAGSALRMDHAVEKSLLWTDMSLAGVLSMATVNPARVGRVAGRQRGVAPGEKADLLRLSWNPTAQKLDVKETIVAGISVYKA